MSNSARPSRFWLITAATVAGMALTASLGVWQLARAAQKRALQDGIATHESQPAWNERELASSANPAAEVYRPVELRGHWLPGANLFLDNRPMNGRTGFVVLSPLRLSHSDRAVLVQRGWVPRDFQDRNKLPEVPTPAGEVRVAGRMAPPPSHLFEFGASPPGPIRQNVDLFSLSVEWRLPLIDGVSVLQTGGDDSGLQRDWPRFVGDEHKHLAYAAQWFAMCAGLAGLYLWFQIIQPRLKRRSHGQDFR